MAGRKSKYETTTSMQTWSVAEYIRLSQEDSDNGETKLESNSITSQKEIIQQYIQGQKDLRVYQQYIDDGYSGTDFKRPGFEEMLEDMKKGNINCIIVKDLSRLGRNYIEVGNYIEQIFPLFNIRFIAINDNVDSYKNQTNMNTIMIPFKNLINDEYCRDTSMKIRTALNGRKRKGEFVGAFPAYGYLKSEEDHHQLVIDDEAAKIVRKIFEWRVNDGMGCLAICHKLNDIGVLNPTGYKRKKLKQKYQNYHSNKEDYFWTVSTVRNILKNDIYIGNITQGKRRVKSYKIHKLEPIPEEEWITVENKHEPIIEKELFEKAQNLRKKDTRVQNDGTLSMWAGILKCSDCGKAMHKKTSKNKSGKIYQYYICGTYQKKSHNLCTKHTIKIPELEQAVLRTVQWNINKYADMERVINELEIGNQIKDSKKELQKEKEEEIERIEILKKGLYEDWKNNDLTKEEYISYKNSYNKTIENLKRMIEHIQKENKEEQKKTEEVVKWIDEIKKQKNITKLNKTVIEELIDYIEIKENQKIIIHFKFKGKK